MSNSSTSSIQVLLADDHPALRLGLKQAVCDDGTFTVIAEASSGLEAYELIKKFRPPIALIDWDMPEMDGLEVLKRIKAEGISTRVAILTLHQEESLVNAAVTAGVDGFVLKDHAIDDILQCLKSVSEGQFYLSPSLEPYLTRRTTLITTMHRKHPGISQLTKKQKMVLSLVSQKLTNKEIALKLAVSSRTIETHRYHLCEKLGLKGSHSLIRFTEEYHSVLHLT